MPPRSRPTPRRRRPRSALVGPVEAAEAIVRTGPLVRATVTSVVACVPQGMLVACSPLLGERAFGEPGYGVLLLSGVAGAALAANAVAARRRRPTAPDTVIRRSAWLQACALLLAASGRPVCVVAAVLAMGAAEGPRLTALFAVRHREAPEHLRAQVFTIGASLKITAFALGAALGGMSATHSLAGTLLAAAGFALLAGLSHAFVRPRRPRRDVGPPATADEPRPFPP